MVEHKAEDYLSALLGGIIIGLAATLNLATYGRITGNSSIFNTLIKLSVKDGLKWKFSFFTGLISAGFLIYLITDKGRWETDSFTLYFFDPIDVVIKDLHIVGWIIGGILVGVGTKMGNGCTSGHGVCGIARLSLRSVAAVWTFMTTGISLATFRHYVPFLESTQSFGDNFEDAWPIVGGSLILAWILIFITAVIIYAIKGVTRADKLEMPVSFTVGFLFGIGLAISGMWRRTKIINFLTIYEHWDPSLMFVMGGAVGVNLITFYLIMHKMSGPIAAPALCMPKKTKIDTKLIVGAAIFGLGWGLAGFCPGPGMIDFFIITHVIVWIWSLALGQLGWEITENAYNKLTTKQEIQNASI